MNDHKKYKKNLKHCENSEKFSIVRQAVPLGRYFPQRLHQNRLMHSNVCAKHTAEIAFNAGIGRYDITDSILLQ